MPIQQTSTGWDTDPYWFWAKHMEVRGANGQDVMRQIDALGTSEELAPEVFDRNRWVEVGNCIGSMFIRLNAYTTPHPDRQPDDRRHVEVWDGQHNRVSEGLWWIDRTGPGNYRLKRALEESLGPYPAGYYVLKLADLPDHRLKQLFNPRESNEWEFTD